jgi:hypothetical protein
MTAELLAGALAAHRPRRLGESHSFYRAAFCEKTVVATRPTKKFCEIAAAPVSPSYCLQIKHLGWGS